MSSAEWRKPLTSEAQVDTMHSQSQLPEIQLPNPVEVKLSRLSARHGQVVDRKARLDLFRAGESLAVRVLQQIENSGHIKSLSAYVTHMIQNSTSALSTSLPAQTQTAIDTIYDAESYDVAFLKELDQQEKVLSPKSPFKSAESCKEPLSSNDKQRSKYVQRRIDIYCEDQVAKKLQLSAVERGFVCEYSRAMEVTEWYRKSQLRSLPPIELLEAHGELCQTKALFVMTFFPEGWEKVLSVEELRKYKEMDMPEVEGRLVHLAKTFENSSCKKMSKVDWTKQKDHYIVFHCEVSCKGLCSFKGPYFETTGSPLQRVFGNAGVLRVHFADYNGIFEGEGYYKKIARDGIWIGLRHYMFFAFKDPKGKKKHGFTKDIASDPKCFFVCTDSLAKADCTDAKFRQFKSILEAQQYIMHIHTVPTLSKRFSRLQLALSQTLPILDLNDPKVKVELIDDIYCRDESGRIVTDRSGEKLIHTDGTGFVSKDIASLCPVPVFKGKTLSCDKDQEFPLLMQVRVFYKGMVAKGTLLVNLELPPSTIQIRSSMVKVTSDENVAGPCYNSLELCATSRKPPKAKLFQHLVLLLIYGGVPESLLLSFVREEMEEMQTVFSNRTAAITALKNTEQGDVHDMALRMLFAGIPLHEAYLQKTLWDMSKIRFQELSRARVAIPETYNLMGCADPTGMLKRNQVTIILQNGPVFSPKVLVYKAPGLHVGDVKVFEATWYREFENKVGNGKYGIFFAVKGPRSVVDEIANSDLDGDQYWVCLNSQLVKHFTPSGVWTNPGTKKVKEGKNFEEVEKEHFETFFRARFKPSYAMGMAANSWLAHMDRYLSLEEPEDAKTVLWCKIQSLIDTYYKAVDAEKTGIQEIVRDEDRATSWPHYMERDKTSTWIKQNVYASTSILGKIYNFIKNQCPTKDFSWSPGVIAIEQKFEYTGYEKHYETWEALFKQYREEMVSFLQDSNCEERVAQIEAIFERYRQMLYKANTLMESKEPVEEVYKRASAIYITVYQRAMKKLDSFKPEDQSQSCLGLQFAWKVAGFALCKLYYERTTGKRKEPILVDEAILRNLKFSRRWKG